MKTPTLKDLELTPEEVAESFAGMDSREQARFFNHIAVIAGNRIDFQLQYITDEHGLNYSGRRVMQGIGQYSHWGLTCELTDD